MPELTAVKLQDVAIRFTACETWYAQVGPTPAGPAGTNSPLPEQDMLGMVYFAEGMDYLYVAIVLLSISCFSPECQCKSPRAFD